MSVLNSDKMSTATVNLNDYDLIKVKGDGNCFYRAVSLFIHGKEDEFGLIRNNVLSYLIDKKNQYQMILGLSNTEWTRLVENAGKNGSWAGDPEISATSEWLNVTIKVRQTNGKWVSFGSGLRTIYLNHVNDNHFDLMVKKEKPVQQQNLVKADNTSYLFWHACILNVGLLLVYMLLMVVKKGNELVLYTTGSSSNALSFINESNHLFWLAILNNGLMIAYYVYTTKRTFTIFPTDKIKTFITSFGNNNMFWAVTLLKLAFIVSYWIGKYDVLLVVSVLFSWYFYSIKNKTN